MKWRFACVLLVGCGAGPSVPLDPFDVAEIQSGATPGAVCEQVCQPKKDAALVACHRTSLEPSLVEHRQRLGDARASKDAVLCKYKRGAR